MTPRDKLEAWVLKISREAFAVDAQAAQEVVEALTGGLECFTPQNVTTDRLHRVAACFLMIARLQ